MDADIEALLAGISDDEPSNTEPQPSDKSPATKDTSNRALGLENEIAALVANLIRLYTPRAPHLVELRLPARITTRVIRTLGNRVAAVPPGEVDPLVAEVGNANALAVRLCLAEDAGVMLDNDTWSEVEAIVARVDQLSAEHDQLIDDAAAALPREAPNLAQLLDPHVAARILARVGDLRQLSVTSPANLVSVRTSPLLDDPLVEQTPAQSKKQAMRIIASKLVLAARMDLSASTEDATQGKLWRRQIEARMDKLLAPPPSLQHRALPKPVDKKPSRRGGKRIRKLKAKQAPSELAREQNIVRFGS